MTDKMIRTMAAGFVAAAILAGAGTAMAAQPGDGISSEMLGRLKASYSNDASNKALRNALAGNSIDVLAVNAENIGRVGNHLSPGIQRVNVVRRAPPPPRRRPPPTPAATPVCR